MATWKRRPFVKLAAAAATLGGMATVAPATAAAGLTRADPVITLVFLPWWVYWDQAGQRLLAEAAAEFGTEPGHQGLRAVAQQGPQGGDTSAEAVISSMLSGVGADIVGDCCQSFVSYIDVNIFENLTPYLQRDNIPLSTWNTGHLAGLQTTEGQMGLPIYDGPMVFVYRQDIFDQLGLAYPDPNWTWEDAAKIWRQLSGNAQISGKTTRRYGAGVAWWPFLLNGFGGAEMDNTHTKSLLGDPQSIAGGQWMMDLIWNNVATTSYDGGYSATNWFVTGQAPMMMRGGWEVHADATNFGTKFKWDYLPVPQYPKGRATFANNDYWGMNANSQHKEGAWELLKWLTAEDYWQTFVMKTTLLEPCKVALWDKWAYYWRQVAPVFRNKAIEWYRDAALGGYGYSEQFFKYQATPAINLENQLQSSLSARKVSVAGGFTQTAKQIDALEATGPAELAAQQRQLQAAEKYIAEAKTASGPIQYPAPPRSAPASGIAPQPTTSITVKAGTVTINADGGAMQGSEDNCLFAGSPATSSRGTFTCRLVSVSLPGGGALNNFPTAKIGLMAASSLSQSAAAAAVFFGGNRGVHGFLRSIDNVGLGDERPASSTATTGFLGQAAVQVATTPAKGGNWLLKPLWLRLVLATNTWAMFTTFDGTHWSPAGAPGLVQFVGAWVGLFATSNGQKLQAVFDQITGFAPSTLVQIGNP